MLLSRHSGVVMKGMAGNSRFRRFGAFEADLHSGELRKQGVRIKLQEQPFQILALLVEHPGDLVTREELRKKLWPVHTYVDFDRSLNKAMTKLRSSLCDSAESPRFIETVHRHGYRFLLPVTIAMPEMGEAESTGAAPPEKELQPRFNPISGKKIISTPDHSGKKSFAFFTGKLISISVPMFLAILLLGAIALTRVYHPVVFGGSSSHVSTRRSIAVLSFLNLSGKGEEAWLSTALSNWLTTELSAGEKLRTVPAESVVRMSMDLALPNVDTLSLETLQRVRKNLNTDLVVVGSYALLGEPNSGLIRLDLRLQDTATGEIIDAVSVTDSRVHLFQLVSTAGEKLRAKLGIQSTTREEAAQVASALPSNSDAARLYSQGLARLGVFDARAAKDLLMRSIAAQPAYALSHLALANSWSQLGYDENARMEAKHAFDLSAGLPRAERLLIEGRYHESSANWPKAIAIYRALVEFYPDNIDYGLALANAQVNAGQSKDALTTIVELRKLPLPLRDDPRIDWMNGKTAESLGDFKGVLLSTDNAAQKAQAIGASLLLAQCRLDRAWALENLGDLEHVETAVREAQQLYFAAHDRKGAAEAATVGGIALQMAGDFLGAKKKYEESLMVYKEMGNELKLANSHDNIADVLLSLGNLAGARKNYEAALKTYREIGHPDGMALAKTGLGEVLLTQGKHMEAKAAFGESLDLCRQVGDRSKEASALSGLGRVYQMEGDFEAAFRNESQARTIFDEIGDKSQSAETQLHLGEVFLEQGKESEAVAAAQHASDFFEQSKAKKNVAAANLFLSRTSLLQGRVAEAQKHIERATAFAGESHNRELELFAAIGSTRVHTMTGSGGVAEQISRHLNAILQDAVADGFVNVALEARLALGEMEMNSGHEAAGRAHLESLEKDAVDGGFRLIAQKAALAQRAIKNQAAVLYIGN